MTQPVSSESVPVAAERPTATILEFPTQPRPAAPSGTTAASAKTKADVKPIKSARAQPQPTQDLPPNERLVRALAKLNAALDEQRAAIATWRSAIGKLKTATDSLDTSLKRYRSTLDTLSGNVASVHVKAKELEKWADDVLNK